MILQQEEGKQDDDDEPLIKDGEPLDSDSEEEPKKKLVKRMSSVQETPSDKKYQQFDQGLTLVSIFGIKDPLREGIKAAVQKCQ